MKIKRVFDGVEVEIELTHDEIAEAYLEHEHYYDCESVRGDLNSGYYEEFEGLSDDAWERAVHEIAYEMRKQMDKFGLDEWDAKNAAFDRFIENRRREIGEIETYIGSVNLGDYDLGGVEIAEEDHEAIWELMKNTGKGLEEIVPEYLLGVRATLDEGLEDEIKDPLEGATLEDLVQDAEKLMDRQKIDAQERDLGER